MRKFPRSEYPKGVPDAKVTAMVNDLSPEALASLIAMSPYLETKFRQLVSHEYSIGMVQAVYVIDAWETDE